MPRSNQSSERWLLELGYALGLRELRSVVTEQGFDDEPQYAALIRFFEALER